MTLTSSAAADAASPSPSVVPIRPAGPTTVPGCPPPAAEVESLDEVLALDDSGSEYGLQGTDPDRARYAAAAFAARYLAAAGEGRCHRLGIVRFGGDAPVERSLALTPVAHIGSRLDHALAPRGPLGATRYAPALERARLLLGTPAPRRRAAVVLVTDGRANDPQASDRRQFEAERQAMEALGGTRVHLVVINGKGTFTDGDRDRWLDLGVASIDRLATADRAAFERLFARLLREDLGLRGDDEHPLPAGGAVTADVGPLNDALVVSSTASDPAAVVEVHDPADHLVRRLTGPAAVVRVPNPVAGRWTMRLTTGRGASVALAAQPLSVRSGTKDGTTWPQGRALEPTLTSSTLAAAVARGDGVSVSAIVRDPRDVAHAVDLRADEAGVFAATDGVATPVRGAYSITYTIRDEGRLVKTTDPVDLMVGPTPYLSIARGPVTSRHPFQLAADLLVRGKPVDPRRVLRDDPDAIATAEVTGDGRRLRDVRVVWRGGGRFAIVSPEHVDDGDRVQVVVHLGATDRDGGDVADRTTVAGVARPSRDDVHGDRVRRAVLGTILVLLAIALAYTTWLVTRPRMTGEPVSINGRSVPVARRRWRRVAGAGGRTVWIFARRGGRKVARTGRLPLPWGTKAIASVPPPTLSNSVHSSIS